jgi:CheY-like chemotaxis protein
MSDLRHSSVPGDHPHDNIPDALSQASAGGTRGAVPSDDSMPAKAHDAEATVNAASPHSERRSRRRALISAPVRVRSVDVTEAEPDEISTTLDVSRGGFLFVSSRSSFSVGMEVAVTFPYSKSPIATQAEQPGRVVRISEMPDGRRAVAIALCSTKNHELVDSGGRELVQEKPLPPESAHRNSDKPVILVVDADTAIRDTLKLYLTDQGYDVVAVGNAAEAHALLSLLTPTLVVAEIEGDDLPGYDLCARIKTTPRLQTIPVMLLTRSAYPSDYANAHSLGAVVCMAKPFRLERFGHVVRLLAPTNLAKEQTVPPRAADPKRRTSNAARARSLGKHTGRNGSRPRR